MGEVADSTSYKSVGEAQCESAEEHRRVQESSGEHELKCRGEVGRVRERESS